MSTNKLNLQIGQKYKTVLGGLVLIYAKQGSSSPTYLGYEEQAEIHLEYDTYGRERTNHAYNLMNPIQHEDSEEPELATHTIDKKFFTSIVEVTITENKGALIGAKNSIILGLANDKQVVIIHVQQHTIDITVTKSNTSIGKAARLLQYKGEKGTR